jgi:murein DD-endopeptidase MepM/ murein hydrolase activator NlpD
VKYRLFRLGFVLLLCVALLPLAQPIFAQTLPVEVDLEGWLDAQPGVLKSYTEGEQTAAEIISGATSYYGLSPRILLTLLETTANLLSDPQPSNQALQQPFGTEGPYGFSEQIDWATRELRAGLGPYSKAPVVQFTDGTTLTLTLNQAPEGVAVQRFLASGLTQSEWRAQVSRFNDLFQQYFDNILPEAGPAEPSASFGFLQRPWPEGTRVTHLAYFDHMYPTVDTGANDNGYVVNYMGQGGMQYDGHDGHDYYFPDQPIGTFILAAADGIAYASTHRGHGVWIQHDNGYVTVYWHLDKFAQKFRGLVNTGRGIPVKAGDLLGSSGKTGFVIGSPHLHFEVRHNGKQVDPYGWFGDGEDPCSAYVACEPSVWLWSEDLVGEFDFTPPNLSSIPDTTPPDAAITLAPHRDLLLYAPFDGSTLQQIGNNRPVRDGSLEFIDGQLGQAVRPAANGRIGYPSYANVLTQTGTIAFWAELPEQYPSNSIERNYLLSSSASPDEGPVYTNTLALRRDAKEQQWEFWTVSAQGEQHELAVTDELAAGWHHFAISWDSIKGSKELYIDGELVAQASAINLPTLLGETFELGRWPVGTGYSGAAFDELLVFKQAQSAQTIAKLVQQQFSTGASQASGSELLIDANATDNAGGIVSVQLGIDDDFLDPQSFQEQYELRLPDTFGEYTITARFFDRAGNSTEITRTVERIQAALPSVEVAEHSPLYAELHFSQSDIVDAVQISVTPDFLDGEWFELPERWLWYWRSNARVMWVRFRYADGSISEPQLYGSDAQRTYLPSIFANP